MKILEVVKANLEYGDTVKLHTWEWLSKKCFHELDNNKENGNLVCPNGYRLLVTEKNLYGKEYKVKNVKTSEFSGLTINCMGKSEISPFEIETITKLIKQEIPLKMSRGLRRHYIDVEDACLIQPEDLTESLKMEDKKCNHQKK